jgi:hypothetical protein
MSAQGTPTAPAGWYTDPQNPAQGRYWDGHAWTELRHTPGQPYPAPPPLKAPAGTDWNTIWIWLIIALPVLPMLLLLFVPWGSMFDFDPTANDPRGAMSATFGLFLSPFYWASLVLGYAVYGLSVFFAYRDMKQLADRGVPKPFHWAFAFIGGVVYTIGRSVVVKRRTGRGHAPLWAEIVVFLVITALVVWIEIVIFSSMADMFSTIPGYYR